MSNGRLFQTQNQSISCSKCISLCACFRKMYSNYIICSYKFYILSLLEYFNDIKLALKSSEQDGCLFPNIYRVFRYVKSLFLYLNPKFFLGLRLHLVFLCIPYVTVQVISHHSKAVVNILNKQPSNSWSSRRPLLAVL